MYGGGARLNKKVSILWYKRRKRISMKSEIGRKKIYSSNWKGVIKKFNRDTTTTTHTNNKVFKK